MLNNKEIQDMDASRAHPSLASNGQTSAEPAAGFTAGPWITETTSRSVWIGTPKAAGAKVAEVVTALDVAGLTDKAEARVFANARLIAAAPMMLDALERLAGLLGGDSLSHRDKLDAYEIADAAIAKATGGAS